MEKILNLTATEIGKKIAKGDLCPVTLTEAYIYKINSHARSKSIFTRTMEESALSQAYASKMRVKNNTLLSSLDGVPISWKDLYDTAAIPTEAGSALLKNRVPHNNAVVVDRASKAGLISLGKTHMTELAFSGLGINPVTQTPGNSLNSKLAPGGSSSGSAVSVALNLAAGSMGSDTGGSVRVPAAWNNLVGLKTTHGLINLKGVVPLCPKFDTLGPIVKSVEDASNFLSAILSDNTVNLRNGNLKGKHVAVIETILLDELDNTIYASFEKTLETLQNNGIQLSRIKSSIISDTMALAPKIFSPEAYGTWADVIEKDPSKMHPPILERFRSGKQVSGPEYVQAWQLLEKLRAKYLDLVSCFDAIVAPTTPILPPEISLLLNDNEYFSEQNLLALRNTRLANLMNLPAVTLPTKTDFCGFMILGKPFQEADLLFLACLIEKVIKT